MNLSKIKLVECKSVPCYLPEEVARQVDEIKKSLPTDKVYEFRRKSVVEVKEVDVYERTDVSYITSPAVDRDRESVDPNGMDLTAFEKNGIVLWNHDQDKPCGKSLWRKKDSVGILAKTLYPTKPENYEDEWLPEKIWGLVQAGILKGKSVGFLPLDIAEPDDELRAKGCELVITKSLLLEYSVVSIPCCPEALVQGINKGVAIDFFAGIKKVGHVQKKKATVAKVVKKDRTPELMKLVEKFTVDPEALAERIIEQIKNRGRI